MNRMVLFFIVIFMASSLYAQENRLTLKECIEIALKENPELKMKMSDYAVASEDVQQSRKDLLPTLSFSANYRRQSTVPSVEFPPIKSPLGGQPISIFPEGGLELGSLDTYDFKLNVVQPVFTGFRLKNRVAASTLQAKSRYHEIEKARADLIFRVESAYANVLKARHILKIAETGKAQVQKHLSDVKNFVDQGLALKSDFLTVKVKLAEAELAVLRAQNGIKMALAALENIMGAPIPPDAEMEEFSLYQVASVDVDSSIRMAMQNREELKALSLARQASGTAIKIVRGNRLPTVSAFASYGYGRPGLDFVKNEWMDYWVVGVGANWTLWNWGKTRSKIQQAQLQSQKVQEALDRARLAIKLDVTQACLHVNEAVQRMQLIEEMESQAEEAFRVVESNYQQGQATNSEYLDAQSDLTRVRLQKIEARIDFAISLANWRRAVGINDENYNLDH